MIDPEIEFHRFFNRENLNEDEFRKHPAKLDLDTIDATFAENLREIKRLINDLLVRNAGNIVTPIGPVALHLDYIAKPLSPFTRFPNAISFTHSGFFFVGLTYDLLELMNEICGLLSQSSLTSDLLGIEADTPEKRNRLFASLFLLQAQFAIDHEIGHHFHGHSSKRGQTFLSSEEELNALLGTRDNLDLQAGEVEADGYAIHMMAKNLFSKETANQLEQRLNPRISINAFLVRFLLLSVASYLYLKPEREFDPGRVRQPKHPFGLMRLNIVMTDFRGWADQHRPEALPYIGQQTLNDISRAIVAAQPQSASKLGWTAQANFLNSPEGQLYRDQLYEARAILRQQMSPHAWKLVDEAGESVQSFDKAI